MRLYKNTLGDSYYIVDGDLVSVRFEGERGWRRSAWTAQNVITLKSIFNLIGNNLRLK